jgi:hypothetical protein
MPCCLVKRYQLVSGSLCLHLYGEALSLFADCLILKLQEMRSSEMFVTTHHSTRQNIPEDLSLQTLNTESEFLELTSKHFTFIYKHVAGRNQQS